MRTKPLGEFEQAVLLAIIRLGGRAYGVPIRRDLSQRLQRDVSFGAVYTTLERLESKGLLSSWLGEATAERGGRAKRYYKVEARAERALAEARLRNNSIWGNLPKGAPA